MRPLTAHVEFDGVRFAGNLGAGLAQFLQNRVEDVGTHILEFDPAAGDGTGHQIGTGFNAIGHDPIGLAFGRQGLDALDFQDVGSRAMNLGAHHVEEVGQIDDLRLARGILDHRGALGQRGGHHEVLGAGHGDEIQYQTAAFQTLGTGMNVAVAHVNLRTHLRQPLEMQVDRPAADRAAARQRDFGLAETRHQRPKHQNRRPHGLHQIIGRDEAVDAACVDFDVQLLVDGKADTHPAQQFHRGGDIQQMRHVAHRYRVFRQ